MGESTKNRLGARIIGIVTSANRNDPQAWSALPKCAMVEFRADGWEASRIPTEFRSFRDEYKERFGSVPETIFTIRLARDGGAWPDSEAAKRDKIWLALGQAGAEYPSEWIDVELEHIGSLSPALVSLIADKKFKVLVSHHNFEGSYSKEALARLGRDMLAIGTDGIKLAVTCRTRSEVLNLMHFTREIAQSRKPAAVLSMGAVGQAMRLLSPLLGCPWTYGYLSGGAVAPGQFSVSQMHNIFTKMDVPMLPDLSDSELLDWVEGRLNEELLAN